MSIVRSDKPFVLAGRTYQSRLLVGTGKYRDMEETRLAIEASGAEIVTFAVRRTNLGQIEGEPNLLEVLSPDRYTFLPNTAGCYDAIEAVRTCRLARELLDGHNLVKLEVLADQKTLFPNVIETLKAAETLVKEGFDVMVYTSDDPIIARQLAEIGCIAVMPLAGLSVPAWGSATRTICRSSLKKPRSRCWWMRAWALPPTRPLPWSWAATRC